MAVQYACEGCGADVFSYGIGGPRSADAPEAVSVPDTVPAHGMCLVCAWLCEHVTDPEAIMSYRINHNLVNKRDEVSLRYAKIDRGGFPARPVILRN